MAKNNLCVPIYELPSPNCNKYNPYVVLNLPVQTIQ
jgi:hypothetical protein